MFDKVAEADFIRGEHDVLRFWKERDVFRKRREMNRGNEPWSFLDGPITANNPMGVHHAWGRTYKDAFQRFHAMRGRDQRYQNGFDCQGLWVEVEVERQLGLTTKRQIEESGIDAFVDECKKRVLRFAARQTEQSVRLGYWMDWDDPEMLRKLAATLGSDEPVTVIVPRGQQVTAPAHEIVARLGNPEWGGSYYTFSTENNETIWAFLKKCFDRGFVYRGHDVMPWSGRGGSAYSQMEVADGRKLTIHESVFARFPIIEKSSEGGVRKAESPADSALRTPHSEFLLVWTTTPWTLTSNVACAVNPDLDYVKLKAKRDGAVYYFAKDNLEYQRLGREFKEGFGRPEWAWPEGVPKLKTIAQIFKEQGGFTIEGTIQGSEMIGWRYAGPFDDLPAQQQRGGVPVDPKLADRTGVSCHRVVDGGRDSRGNPNVVAGEGTGIVHIAPGCGDVDYQLGQKLGIVGIAPLDDEGRFIEGFGEFTGREAIDPATPQLVFDHLKEKGYLVAVEDYPHVYPHCWRTGDELVFRLVDEWFIDMGWREEIMAVTKQIRWLPASIQGEERELEWLANMRDWMISKKRFWGLALPIWVDDEDPAQFEVMGSLAELKERAVAGWDEFAGHTPHRPWIDRVKIKNPKTGNLMSRIPDVGNPWLDAGIVSLSTMHYNTNRAEWEKWFPADFVTECFPGQFRNWFYALLSMSAMMVGRPPTKTLLGHRLVMNEEGKPMHKTDGTAIWFEEAAEQLGVDTVRWMYLAQNPASDLRFGTRHADEPVTLQTPAGPITETLEGLPTCRVTSKPADETRRMVLIPLWNSYAFFVNYARLDGFDPGTPPVPVYQRPEIDRWILSNLQALVAAMNRAFEEFDSAEACRAAAAFIDDLSNWYIRRNRRRFWRSREGVDSSSASADEARPPMDRDKLAAYQTLYEVLVTLTKLLAPLTPFLSERMYQNLCRPHNEPITSSSVFKGPPSDAPESVHLCDYPQPDRMLLDPELNERMAAAQLVVRLGHNLRDRANIRVRQPLAELRYASANARRAAAIDSLSEVVREELNVKRLVRAESLDDLAQYSYKPNLKTLGPKYGKLLGKITQALPSLSPDQLRASRANQPVEIAIDGSPITLDAGDVLVEASQAAGWLVADEGDVQVALSTKLTPELKREGMARDFVRQVQQLRKEANLEIQDRIRVFWTSDSGHVDDEAQLKAMIREWSEYISAETLADSLGGQVHGSMQKRAYVGEVRTIFGIERVM
ncbi:MAG: class I tRNA ligase family protein [Planctomycetales bacterium]